MPEKIVRIVDFCFKENHECNSARNLPAKLKEKFGITTTAKLYYQEKPQGRQEKPVMELHVVNIPRYLARFRICLATLLCLYEKK